MKTGRKSDNSFMKRLIVKLGKRSIYVVLCVAVLIILNDTLKAQVIVDKTVATVSDGVRTELITYSDLLWQLALVPDIPIDPPVSEDLNRALQVIIRQRLIALEAKRLPREEPSKKEVAKEIKRILDLFSPSSDFVERLNAVGFNSVDDENFQRIIEDRVAIEKYVDFRFRSFVVITPEDESQYYQIEFSSEFKRQNPGVLLPPIDQMRIRINEILTERKVESEIEAFLDNARDRAEIIVLDAI
jgi:hypothetical protein